MGIREDQLMGLNEWAREFVTGEEVPAHTEEVTRTYPNGRVTKFARKIMESSVKREESGEFFSGMFGDEYPLHKYTFPDGKVYYEVVQAVPWSSGPVFFLALTIYAPDSPDYPAHKSDWHCLTRPFFVPESLWSEDEIDNA